jgi:hypothetical protein
MKGFRYPESTGVSSIKAAIMIYKITINSVASIFVFSSVTLIFLSLAGREVPASLLSLALATLASSVSLIVPSPLQK